MPRAITSSEEVSSSKIIAMVRDTHVYVVVREKTSYAFAPMISTRDHMYKGKNLKQCVANALAKNERIIQAESYRELYEHLRDARR